jgi:hypothetical protein
MKKCLKLLILIDFYFPKSFYNPKIQILNKWLWFTYPAISNLVIIAYHWICLSYNHHVWFWHYMIAFFYKISKYQYLLLFNEKDGLRTIVKPLKYSFNFFLYYIIKFNLLNGHYLMYYHFHRTWSKLMCQRCWY